METNEKQSRRSGRKTLYKTPEEKRAALRERQARYNAKRALRGRNVDVYLPLDLYEKLVAKAGALGVSRTLYVKTLIAEAVSR